MASEEKQTLPRTLSGVVVKNGMHKGIVVYVERRIKHPIYGKFIKRSTKVHAHDEENTCNVGDTVVVQECKPISKTKCWKLIDVKERAA
jgi:small subunit ribosomal protein S17